MRRLLGCGCVLLASLVFYGCDQGTDGGAEGAATDTTGGDTGDAEPEDDGTSGEGGAENEGGSAGDEAGDDEISESAGASSSSSSGGMTAVGGATPGTGATAGSGAQPVVGTGGTSSTGGMSSTGGTSTGGTAPGMGGAAGSGVSAGGAGAGEGEAVGGTGGTDQYDAPGTNPFVLVAFDPLSTFAADTDTASYDLFRRDIEDGMLPDPDGVRVEEYVNFFEYDYPIADPAAEVPFSLELAAAPNVLARDTVMLRVGIQGKAAPPAAEKPPANLVFLVDVSGSMGATDKLPLVQYTLSQALEVLAPTDQVSIVTYSDLVAVALPPTPVSEVAAIQSVIDSLVASGSTAGGAALEVAYTQAEHAFIEGGMNHVLLCTDGDFNVGTTSTDGLVALIEEKRVSGITLTVLGYGSGNLNDAMMETVSNKGDGVYAHVSSAAIADEYVTERLLSNLFFIAKDMKIQVEFNPELVHAYRLLGYENRAIADELFTVDSIDAGEVGAGHQVTALYELVLPGGEVPLPEGAPEPLTGEPYTGAVAVAAGDLALVKIRYKDRTATAEDPAYEVDAALPADAVAASAAETDGSFQWALAVAAFAEILKGSPYGDPAELDAIEQLVVRPVHEDFPDRAEFATLFAQARDLLE